MTDAYQRALARREVLQTELSMIEQYLDLHTKLFGAARKVASIAPKAKDDEDADVDKRNDPRAIADAAAKILAGAERPMQRGKLIEAVEQRGISIQSTDKNKYIGTVMWRNL